MQITNWELQTANCQTGQKENMLINNWQHEQQRGCICICDLHLSISVGHKTTRLSAYGISLTAPRRRSQNVLTSVFHLLQSVFCTHLIKTTSERPRLSEKRVWSLGSGVWDFGSGVWTLGPSSAGISALNMNYCQNAGMHWRCLDKIKTGGKWGA